MSIKPPSDIVLDVARAADPASSAAATERLAKIAGDSGKSDPAFGDVMAEVETEPPVAMAANAGAPIPVHASPAPLLRQPQFSEAPVDAETKVYAGFQAVLLQNVLSMMLPESGGFSSVKEVPAKSGARCSLKNWATTFPRKWISASCRAICAAPNIMKQSTTRPWCLRFRSPILWSRAFGRREQSLDITPKQS